MKFGHEYKVALRDEGFPQEWVESAIDYKHLKKVIKMIHDELQELGLDAETLDRLRDLVKAQDDPPAAVRRSSLPSGEFYSASQPGLTTVTEEFTPQLRILVDNKTGTPLDVSLAPETKASLRRLVRHEMVLAGRREHLGKTVHISSTHDGRNTHDHSDVDHDEPAVDETQESLDARWIQVPLATARDFFDALEPSFVQLDTIRATETRALEEEILDLGDAVTNVVQPVRAGFETKRDISYRDLYFWREMFRLYIEMPIFYKSTERTRGALTFTEAKQNLVDYDTKLRETGLLAKMKTPQAKLAAQQFLDLNLHILKTMQFQEMNARAMTKILKKFDKQTHLGGNTFIKALGNQYPSLISDRKSIAGNFSDSIAQDLTAEIGSKVLAIVPQLDDWVCPVCYGMAWRPVNLGCCRSVFCIRCIIKLQKEKMKRCPMCNAEKVMKADGRNIDFATMEFLETFFPLEVKKRQKENEREQMASDYGEEFVRKDCVIM
jgi:hypothetical protein